jgi:hypothetical protein
MRLKILWLGVLAVVAVAAAHTSQTPAPAPTLASAVEARPFTEYGTWWRIGNRFAGFMSDAIVPEWKAVQGTTGDLTPVRGYIAEYIETVYGRDARPGLVDEFAAKRFATPLESGEFDALSYAFFRSAFESIARHPGSSPSVEAERRAFTRRVGKRFFGQVHDHLGLRLPTRLGDDTDLAALKASIASVVAFLQAEGYFRDRAAFRLDVHVPRKSGRIAQPEAAVADRLAREGRAYALFEMSYPVILPSAVYLYQTIGEAQHHSSRTIEELFDRVGYTASETSDFDPSGFPSDLVVELWEITPRATPRSR